MKAQPASYRTLNAWRGVAALCVVFYHVVTEMTTQKPGLGAWPAFQAMGFGFLGVQIFFVISGYCIANAVVADLEKGHGVRRFLHARVRRIYPPLLWALLVAALCKVGLEGLVAGGVLPGSALPEVPILHQSALWYFANLTLTQELFGTSFLLRVAWTLCYEAAFYLIVAVVMAAILRAGRGRQAVMDVLHGLTALALAGLIAFPDRVFYPLDLWPEFGAGVLVFDLLTSPARRRAAVWAVALVVLGLVFVATENLPIGGTHESSRLTFAVAGVFAVGLVLCRPFDARIGASRVGRVFSGVGMFSYSLYLLHYLIITGLLKTLSVLSLPVVVEAGMLVAGAVTGGYLFYRFFENPYLTRKPGPSLAPAPTPRADPVA